MEGDQTKTTASDFFNPVIDGFKTEEQKNDIRQVQFIPYDEIDWSYPNIVVVIGQESRGISYAIAKKGFLVHQFSTYLKQRLLTTWQCFALYFW